MTHSKSELRTLALRFQFEDRWRQSRNTTQAEKLATLARIYNLLSGSVSPDDATLARELTYELIRSLTEEMQP